MKRRLLVLTAVGAAVIASTLPVLAGGAWMDTTRSHYEPGQHVVAVGYVQDGNTEGPFYASLGVTPVPELPPDYSQTWLILGEVEVQDSGLHGYLANRVSFEFDVPVDLPSGEYEVAVRNADDEFLGDLIGFMLYVGFDPGYERWIEWPLDEPRIADLAPDDVIAGPGWAVSVADLNEGNYPPEAAEFMLDPESLPSPPDTNETAQEAMAAPTSSSTASTTATSDATAIAQTTAAPEAEPESLDAQPSAVVAAESPEVAAEASRPGAAMAAVALGLIAIVGIGWIGHRRVAARREPARQAHLGDG